MSIRIRCKFVPQAWVNDWAVTVDAEGPLTWEMEVDKLPKQHSYESDDLRECPQAPEWVREWDGPFEVEFEEVAKAGAS